MKTVKTQIIDGLEIIVGIGDAGGMIDPETTRRKVEGMIQKSEEWKTLSAKKNEMQGYAYQARQAGRNAARAKTPAEKNRFSQEWKDRWADIKKCQDEMKPIAVALQSRFTALMMEHAEYFDLKPDETYVDDAEAEIIETAMTEATAAGELVKRDKSRVKDFRGRTFWKKLGQTWVRTGALKLGDTPPSGAVEEKDLTTGQQAEISAQIEKERIAALSSAARVAERDAVIAGLVARAGAMKSELEVSGDAQALAKSQAWLTEETAKAMVRYG